MDAEQGRPEAPSRKIRRISAYRFLALLILPAALLLGVAGLAVFLSLDTIRQITDSLEEEHLPGILDSQRTVDNINVLRSEAAVVFMAEDPDQRRAARLKVQALVAESVFERSPEITGLRQDRAGTDAKAGQCPQAQRRGLGRVASERTASVRSAGAPAPCRRRRAHP